MGVPREPIQLIARADGVRSADERVRLSGVQSAEDWTDRMQRWARERAEELASLQISGFVLKARSPSCGPGSVLVHHADRDATPTGRGLFAEALAKAMPGLPMEDEERLEDPLMRERFIQRMREYYSSVIMSSRSFSDVGLSGSTSRSPTSPGSSPRTTSS
jgi:uncharacterized protein YbbK (DUF523 family)